MFVDFETSTDGTEVTNAILVAATHGSIGTSTWSTQHGTDTTTPGTVPNITIEEDAAFPLYTPVTVGETTYSDSGTRGIRVVMASGVNNSIDLPISGVTLSNPTSIGFNMRFNGAQINSSPRDVVGMRSDPTGGFQFLQLYDGNPPNFRAHFQPPYTVTTSGANIVKGRWYWVTMSHVGAGNTYRVRLYDTTDNYSMQEQSGTVQTTSIGMTRLKIGIIKYGSGSSQSIDFDNIVISTAGTYPLGPGDGPSANGHYWVSATGAAAWASAQSETPLSGTACASIATMNNNLAAGDNVYLRAGTYSTQIDPTGTSPTSEAGRVTIAAYNGEAVTISGLNDFGIDLTGWDYVTIDDIDITNCEAYLLLSGSDRNIFQNCNWHDAQNVAGEWVNGVRITGSSQYNQFIDCIIRDVGDSTTGDDLGGVITIGSNTSSTDQSTHNLFLRCTLARGGHQVVTAYSGFNRWQDCHFFNDPWMDRMGTDYGNRNLLFDGRGTAFNTLNIVDNCTLWRAARPVDAVGVSSVSLRSPGNIIRRSRFVDGADAAISIVTFGEHSGYSPNGLADDNHVYHNTIVYNGINTGNTDDDQTAGLTLFKSGGTTVADNRIKNNIFWDNVDDRAFGDEPDTLIALQTFAGNRAETTDPLFINWDTGDLDPSNPAAHDFRLTASSTSIDAGAWLTTITSATGSGTSFVVEDAGYFTDGEGIYAGDILRLEGSTVLLSVGDVNYSTNTITFSNSVSWTQGAGVALNYVGSAPDQGAFEFVSQAPVTPQATINNIIYAP